MAEPVFYCSICPNGETRRVFGSHQALTQHCTAVHFGAGAATASSSLYHCTGCLQNFESRFGYESHILGCVNHTYRVTTHDGRTKSAVGKQNSAVPSQPAALAKPSFGSSAVPATEFTFSAPHGPLMSFGVSPFPPASSAAVSAPQPALGSSQGREGRGTTKKARVNDPLTGEASVAKGTADNTTKGKENSTTAAPAGGYPLQTTPAHNHPVEPALPVASVPGAPGGTHLIQASAASVAPAQALRVAPVDDHAQAKKMIVDMLHLRMQVDLFITTQGALLYDGLEWTRIPAFKQPEAAKLLNDICSLPSFLQAGNYMPKLHLDDPEAPYRTEEFKLSPKHDGHLVNSHKREVVALALVKIQLEDGIEEVVKIGAIDVLTGEVLLCHLVWPDIDAKVKDWRTSATGMKSFAGLVHARQEGYRILRGWKAGREVLYRFVDQSTILIGLNLRADMDSLRIIHGRGIDIGLHLKQAANNGPLPKAQFNVNVLCRDLLHLDLWKKMDQSFGHDAVIYAFAIRQLVLWMIKKDGKVDGAADLKRYATAKSRAYELLVS